MSASYAIADCLTMLGRNLKRLRRYPSLTVMLLAVPIVFLLLFVYVFGETLGAGLGDAGRAGYLRYVLPGIVLMTVASGAQGTAIAVATDLTQGIIARFRTMAIFRPAILTGHVVGAVLQTMLIVVAVVAVAVLIGFRSGASVWEWLAATGLVALTAFAMTWLSVAMGLVSKTVEGASNLPLPLVFLPFLGSGFVPTGSMPTALRWFAEYQPFTPIMETLRGLLLGTAIGHHGAGAVAWCLALSALGYAWARRSFNRERS
ncbi:transport permease protein [Virgisporangium aliadipatigenens]|uniref:Transport permease protein n=1 Tax=Virgisporangium aliadipatigenens TaxID=741659 RepID=A0A8J3YNL7_9ACTN|nr:ABC transporter permease [Virgisporangium aliadipatigenens]GIJ47165.1 transport permease protein [Virgisporangium aliadipatigenens]